MFCCGSVEWPAVGWRRGAVDGMARRGDGDGVEFQRGRRRVPRSAANGAGTKLPQGVLECLAKACGSGAGDRMARWRTNAKWRLCAVLC